MHVLPTRIQFFGPAIRWSRLYLFVLLTSLLALNQGSAQNVDDGGDQQPPVETDQQDQRSEFSPMNNRRLGELLKKHFPDHEVEGDLGAWQIRLTDGANEDLIDDDAEPEESADEEVNPGAGERVPPVLIVLTDERADRMRIMMAIRPFDPQRVDDLRLALIALHANYDRALDARYAVHDQILWSAFIHPLGSLTPTDLANGLRQVQTLRETTGTTYSSGDLIFGPAGEQEPARKDQDPQQPIAPDDTVARSSPVSIWGVGRLIDSES